MSKGRSVKVEDVVMIRCGTSKYQAKIMAVGKHINFPLGWLFKCSLTILSNRI